MHNALEIRKLMFLEQGRHSRHKHFVTMFIVELNFSSPTRKVVEVYNATTQLRLHNAFCLTWFCNFYLLVPLELERRKRQTRAGPLGEGL